MMTEPSRSCPTVSVRKWKSRGLFLAAVAALLACGCATSPVKNAPLDHFDPEQGYRLQNLKTGEHNSDSLFVILTFSGGGTRAASFAFGVLEALRDTPIVWEGEERRLLDEVDVISSVSGGSLPSAYYGLFRDRIFDEFPEKVLYQNIQGGIIKQVFTPRKSYHLFSPLYTRTDIMADGFDRNVFEHKTYADLLAMETRPYIIVNSTDMALGCRFGFTQDTFDCLYSDLSQFPVGHAAAASACFPGAFPPMTLKNHEHGSDYVLPQWVQEDLASADPGGIDYRTAMRIESYSDPNRTYVHLMDGGVADNLGLLPAIQALHTVVRPQPGRLGDTVDRIQTVLIITVNAAAHSAQEWDAKKTPLGLVASLLSAGTTPMGNFTNALVAYMKLLMEVAEFRADADENLPDLDLHFVEVSFDYVEDQEEQEQLNAVPTSFKLKREQVDHLRAAAAQILGDHPAFQEFLSELKETE